MSRQFEFVRATLKTAGDSVIGISRGESEVRVPLTVLTIGGTTNDPGVWKTASWWFAFRENGEFGVDVAEPHQDAGGRGAGLSIAVTVTLPLHLLPDFWTSSVRGKIENSRWSLRDREARSPRSVTFPKDDDESFRTRKSKSVNGASNR